VDFSAKCSRKGPLFEFSALSVADSLSVPAVEAATQDLAGAIAENAPKASGKLAGSVAVIGSGLNRRVQVGEWYGIPLEAGVRPGFVPIQSIAQWASVKLGLDDISARRMAFAYSRSRSTTGQPRNSFFYRTFDRVRGLLMSRYLEPIAAGIASKLDG